MFASTAARRPVWGHSAGFTIVELMVTVAVASVLMAIAVPSFNQIVVSNRLTTQSNDMVGAISVARSEAITRNARITLCRVPNNSTVCVTSAGDWQNWVIRTAAGTVIRQGNVNSYGGTLLMRSTLTNDQVVFGPDGLARTGTGMVDNHTITLCSRRSSDRNLRLITLGMGSRMSTTVDTNAACTI
jgi:type IV fimbrial biogenesis protein FimT